MLLVLWIDEGEVCWKADSCSHAGVIGVGDRPDVIVL